MLNSHPVVDQLNIPIYIDDNTPLPATNADITLSLMTAATFALSIQTFAVDV